MKKVILSIAVIAMIGFTACKNQTEDNSGDQTETADMQEMAMTETTFGVRGNCSMCKSTIETAAKSVEGVTMAEWDKGRKMVNVAYDDSMTDEMAIHNAIAASGYDTEMAKADDQAYGELPECCKYDRNMEMNLSQPMEGGNDHH